MKWWDKHKEIKRLKREQAENKRNMKRTQMRIVGKVKRKGKAALCLGGGGARGFAHIGALHAFKEEGIDFDIDGRLFGGQYRRRAVCCGGGP